DRKGRLLDPDRADPALYAVPVLLGDRLLVEDNAGDRADPTDVLAREPDLGELPNGFRERYVRAGVAELRGRLRCGRDPLPLLRDRGGVRNGTPEVSRPDAGAVSHPLDDNVPWRRN